MIAKNIKGNNVSIVVDGIKYKFLADEEKEVPKNWAGFNYVDIFECVNGIGLSITAEDKSFIKSADKMDAPKDTKEDEVTVVINKVKDLKPKKKYIKKKKKTDFLDNLELADKEYPKE